MAPPGSLMSTTYRSAGRGDLTTPSSPSSSHNPIKLTLTTRNLRIKTSLSRDESNTAASSASPISPDIFRAPRTTSKQNLRNDMSSPHHAESSVVKIQSSAAHTKLHKHKRANSASSLPGPPSPFPGSHPHFHTPFATYEEPFPDAGTTPTLTSNVPKIKPYLRKMSAAKEDQGMIDLSKSTSENDRLAGLGIQDFATKSASDVSFAHTRRGHNRHGRTTSVGSQISSGSAKPGHTFVHPMAKTPRPYTPPTGKSYASSLADEEANESDDVVEDDFRMANGFRTRRSISVSSTPATNPTPLSQSHTASDLGLVPKLTSTSQSNLSTYSDKSSRSRKNRPRGNTDLSQDWAPPPSSRPSLDKAISLVSKRNVSDPEPQTRDEKILAARRKFEEKEAIKDRKQEARSRSRRNSSVLSALPLKPALKQQSQDAEKKKKKNRRKSSAATAGADVEDEKRPVADFSALSYEDHGPTHAASLPRYGVAPGGSEKVPKYLHEARPCRQEKGSGGVGMRFSTWFQTRMLSCGGKE